jgi:sucrose-6-phosphate hydrolase SacC (GH32 family)
LFFTLVETEEDQSVHSYVAHSESSDLVAWTKPVKITPRSDRDYSSPGNVVKVGDEWVLCFQSYPRPGNRNDGIVRCANSTARLFTSKSKDMQNWSAPELLKVKGPDVPEEKMNRMIDPYLIQDDKCVWWCFYKERVNSVSGVSMSRSADLRIWEPAGRTNGGENVCVVRDSDGYLMMHSPRYGMKFKRSTDLMKWHDLPNRLTLDGEKRPWSKGRLTAGVLLDGRNVAWCGKWILFFHGSGPKTESEGDFDRNASIAVSMQK